MSVRILVVDDHDAVRESLRFVFAAAGFQPLTEATTRAEAVDALQNRSVDVVLLDIALREENSLDALRELKAINPAAAVLVHSHYDNPRLLSGSYHEGAAGYLLKGEDKNALIHAVEEAAAGASLWTVEQRNRIREADAEMEKLDADPSPGCRIAASRSVKEAH